MEENRPFYCEKTKKNCPFESKFRYCIDCDPPKCLIKNKITGEYLSAIYIGTQIPAPKMWKDNPNYAIPFANIKAAQATITFLGAVLNWELELQLQIIELID